MSNDISNLSNKITEIHNKKQVDDNPSNEKMISGQNITSNNKHLIRTV